MRKALEKMSHGLEKTLSPVAGKLASNRYLVVIATSFMTILPLILIGSFALILSQPIVDYHVLNPQDFFYPFMKKWAELAEVYGPHLNFLFGITLGSQGIYLSLAIAYNTAIKQRMNVFMTMLVAFVSFLLVNSQYVDWHWDTTYFGGTGLFSAILTTFISVEFYHFLVRKKVGSIDFPDTVPASLKESISALVPLACVFLFMGSIRLVLAEVFATSFPQLMMMIGQPLNIAVDTVFGVSLASVISQIGWWFGIHSSAILSVVMPSFDANTLENAAAFAVGTPLSELPRIVTSSFYFNFVAIGGGGATLGLVLLMMRSKSIQIRTVAKLAIVPGIFGINEPILFGLPIVLNPIFLLPFLGAQVVNIFLCYGAMSVGLVHRTVMNVSSTVPVGLGQVLSSLDPRALGLTIVCIIANMAVYYPFYRMFEKEKLAEEQQEVHTLDEAIEVL
ncbi:PTS sugar transporter subunit IIC [Enterococcus canis]|nr:PTS transporter subunit EIIC [Enterococcus canis]